MLDTLDLVVFHLHLDANIDSPIIEVGFALIGRAPALLRSHWSKAL